LKSTMREFKRGGPGASELNAPRGGIRALWKLMLPYILAYKGRLLLIIALVILSNLILLCIPTFTGRVVDAIGLGAGQVDFPAIYRLGGIILGLSLAGWLLEVARNTLMTRVTQRIIFELRQTVFGRLLHLPLSFLESNTKGDLISRISMDIDQISETITSDIITTLTGVVTISGALVMMVRLSPPLSCIFLLIIPLIVLTARIISRRSRRLFRQKKIAFALLSAHAEEMITAQKTVKLFGLEGYNLETYEGLSAAYEKAGQEAEFSSSQMMPSMNAINNLSFLLISIAGCLLFLKGSISIGSISSFIIYSKKFTSPITEIANLYGTFQSALSSCDRINYLLSQPEEVDLGQKTPDRLAGRVEFNDVSFSYTPGTPTLEHISFRAEPGEKIAIVGETGSGKTTLMNLLLRFYDYDSGSIRIDGADIREMPLRYLRRSFALVLQENFVFEMSIAENIDYAAHSGDSGRIRQAAREVEMDGYIASLPLGYETPLNGDSDKLSQGQRQLLTIARALMVRPQLFIFDEATSSVDTRTEQRVKEVMDRVMEGKTSFIIAHRLSTILSADRILVIQNGRLIEQGTHAELLEKHGVYYEMYQSQFASI
jgi:ATP-binding cassette subfamily B multidrug efflux pump